MQAVAPAWDEPLVSFLAGGLLGVFLYQFWVTALTSLAGTLVMGYSGLCLLERFARVDGAALAGKHAPLLDWGCGSCAVLGILVQLLLERRRRQRERKREEARRAAEQKARKPPPPPRPPKVPWWLWPAMLAQRKAG